jgi:hypothetical protein
LHGADGRAEDFAGARNRLGGERRGAKRDRDEKGKYETHGADSSAGKIMSRPLLEFQAPSVARENCAENLDADGGIDRRCAG